MAGLPAVSRRCLTRRQAKRKMTILHAHSAPHFAAHLRAVLADANAHPHSVDIAVGCYFYLPGFALVADLLPTHPGKVRILTGRTDCPVPGANRRRPTWGRHAGLLANGSPAGRCRVDAGLTAHPLHAGTA